MAATLPASTVALDYCAPRLRPRVWSKWWAPVLFQVGTFGTTVAVLSLRDARAPNGPLPAWFTAGDLPIFCWFGHSLGFMFVVLVTGGLEAVLRGPFRCVVIGMLFPLALAAATRLCAAISGGEAEGAAIAFLSPLFGAVAGLLMVRELPAPVLTSMTREVRRSRDRISAAAPRR